MNRLLAAALITPLALGLAACEDKKPAPAPAPAPANGSGAAPAPAPKAATPASTPASATAPAPTQETPEGTMQLFINAVKKGDFMAAADLCDPSSLGHKELMLMAEAVDRARDIKERMNDDSALNLILAAFTSPYANATFKKVTEQPPRARVELTLLGDTTPKTVDLSQLQGKWFLIAPQDIVRTDASKLTELGGQRPAPAATPPAPPADPSGK